MPTRLGDMTIGSTVKLAVNGTLYGFLIVHQGNPNADKYDASCDDTWLLMEDIYENRQWHNVYNTNSYASSTIHSYLNSTFLSLLDDDIQAEIKQVKIPYRTKGSGGYTVTGSSGLSTKIFLLSCTEVNFTGAGATNTSEGAPLAYFSGCEPDGKDDKRIAYLDGTAALWWLRSPHTSTSGTTMRVSEKGDCGGNEGSECTWGVRPAFIMPDDLMINDNGEVTFNLPPSDPGEPLYPEPIAGSQAGVTWAASVDPEGDEITYTVEKSLDGGVFSQVGQTTGNSMPIDIPPAIYPGSAIPISWAAAEGAEGYAIQRSLDLGVTWEDLATTTETSYIDTAPNGPCTMVAKDGAIVQIKYRVASMAGGAVATDYTVGGDPSGAPALIRLGDMAVGRTIKLPFNGTLYDFLVVHQGKPSDMYDDSCAGTWLLMKDCYENRAWHSSVVNDYAASDIHSYLNNGFLRLFDEKIQAKIKSAKIPYVNGTGPDGAVASGADGLETKIFLLGGYEVGFTQSKNPYYPIDGDCLDYFKGAVNADRIAYLDGTATSWWTRSPDTSYAPRAWSVMADGDGNGLSGPALCTNNKGIRPALILPSVLTFDENGEMAEPSAAGAVRVYVLGGVANGN